MCARTHTPMRAFAFELKRLRRTHIPVGPPRQFPFLNLGGCFRDKLREFIDGLLALLEYRGQELSNEPTRASLWLRGEIFVM